MKSMAAVVPARPSKLSVPVSQTYGRLGVLGGQVQRLDLCRGFAACVHEADVRAEELVRRAEQEVAAHGAHVDGAVQRVVHGVDDAPGAGGAGQRGRARDIVHGADGVRRVAQGHDLGATWLDELFEGRPVERAGREVHRDLADHDAALRELQPGAAVGLVIERRDHDLVTGLQAAPEGFREEVREGGHVGAEADLVRVAAEEVGAGRVSLGDRRVGLLAGGEAAAVVGVVVDEVLVNGVEHALRRLRAARPVEIGGRPPVDRPLEGRELAAHVGDVVLGHGLPSGRACTRAPAVAGTPSVSRRRA